jgi:hypothetical protein
MLEVFRNTAVLNVLILDVFEFTAELNVLKLDVSSDDDPVLRVYRVLKSSVNVLVRPEFINVTPIVLLRLDAAIFTSCNALYCDQTAGLPATADPAAVLILLSTA